MKLRETIPDYAQELSHLSDGASRDHLVLSVGVSGAVRSRYGDTLWDFSPYIKTKNTSDSAKKINFASLIFVDGSKLTDDQHSSLLARVKDFLLARLAHKHPTSGKNISHKTLYGIWTRQVKPLLYWMTSVGHTAFNQLDSGQCKAYVKHCQAQKTNANSVRGRQGKPLAPGTLQARYVLLQDLYAMREYLRDPLPEHPWPGESAGSLAGVKWGGQHRVGKTEQIPERLNKQLTQGALYYVEQCFGARLLVLRKWLEQGRDISWHLARLRNVHGQPLKTWRECTDELNRAFTACYVTIDELTGLRDSEMASLKLGCYSVHEGWDGEDYGWLSGTTYKLEQDPKPAEWMAPPVVAQAVSLIKRVTAPLRAELAQQVAEVQARIDSNSYLIPKQRTDDIEHLHNLQLQQDNLFIVKNQKTGAIGQIRAVSMYNRLKLFAKYLNLMVTAEDIAKVRDKDKIQIGEIWPLSAHMFRKTFAVTVARHIFGDIRYLREHFKHWSLDMTLLYAIAEESFVDDTLFEEILSERDELQVAIIGHWIDIETPVTGNASGEIVRWRQRGDVRVAKDPKDAARKLAQSFFLRGTGHSWCTSASCKGLGIYNVLACKDCDNRLIDDTFIPVWRGIRQQQIDVLSMDDIGDPMWQRAVDHLDYAEQVLADLGTPVNAYPRPPKPSERRKSV